MRLAIDIGSNTIKCLLGEAVNGRVSRVYEESLDNRIMASGGSLCAGAAEMIADSVKYFEAKAAAFNTSFDVETVATSALRDYGDRDEIIAYVLEKTGRKITVLSGEDEARLAYLGALSDPALNDSDRCAFFDLGGGSMEVVFGFGGKAKYFKSLPLGAVRLTRELSGAEECAAFTKEVFAKNLADIPQSDFLAAAGGAVAAARIMKKKLGLGGEENVIKLSEIEEFLSIVLLLTLDERVSKFSISANRADILPAAFVCVAELMKFLHKSDLTHTFCNLRYGLIIENRKV